MSEEKNNHPVLKTLTAAAAVGTAAYAGFSFYVFKNVFDVQVSEYHPDTETIRKLNTNHSRNDAWYIKSERKDVFIESFDGLKLHATQIINHADSHKWMLTAHGYRGYGLQNMNLLYEADAHGYNILAIDQRACGMSSGRYTGMGWSEHYDVSSWIGYLTNLDPESKICLYGSGMGAASIMNAVGDYMPANVVCAVEEGGFSGIRELLVSVITDRCKINGSVFAKGIDLYAKQILHFSIYDANTRRQLMQSSTPMLFVHGEIDSAVPVEMVYDCYYACAADKELYTVANADHDACISNEHYLETVFAFMEKHLENTK